MKKSEPRPYGEKKLSRPRQQADPRSIKPKIARALQVGGPASPLGGGAAQYFAHSRGARGECLLISWRPKYFEPERRALGTLVTSDSGRELF